MQSKFFAISIGLLVAFAAAQTETNSTEPAIPSDVTNVQTETPESGDDGITTYLLTEHQFKRWLATTDADLTFHGKPILDLDKRDGNTMVTYCNNRIDNICGGTCQVYNGGPTCIDAPGTKCIAATNDVGFCDRKGCGHSCHQISTCGTSLENNFCYTPGTQSILVGA